MEAITIHPENAEQLKALKMPFESQSDPLPPQIVKSIDKSLKQFANQQVISLEEFKDKHFSNH